MGHPDGRFVRSALQPDGLSQRLGTDRRSVTFEQPVPPTFVDEVILRRLSVGEARVDVALRQAGTGAAVHVLAREGDIRVMTTS